MNQLSQSWCVSRMSNTVAFWTGQPSLICGFLGWPSIATSCALPQLATKVCGSSSASLAYRLWLHELRRSYLLFNLADFFVFFPRHLFRFRYTSLFRRKRLHFFEHATRSFAVLM